MRFPEDLKYTKDHEWTKIHGKIATVGITEHAQHALGDVVFVELPKVGRVLKPHETFGVVESIKAVSDLYSPLGGKVLEVNSSLTDDPSLVNRDPQGEAWMIKLELPEETQGGPNLMDARSYEALVASLKQA